MRCQFYVSPSTNALSVRPSQTCSWQIGVHNRCWKVSFLKEVSRQSELQSRKAFGRGPAGGCVRRGGRTWASLTTQDAIQCIHYKSPCPNGQGVGLLIRRCSLAQSCMALHPVAVAWLIFAHHAWTFRASSKAEIVIARVPILSKQSSWLRPV